MLVNPVEMPGKKFGEWTVLQYIGPAKINKTTYFMLKCRCSCGTIRNITSQNLSSGKTTKCRAHISKTMPPEYRIWVQLLWKAKNKKIRVHSRWQKFDNFYEDMKKRPAGMSLGRLDFKKGFSPANCKWMTRNEIMSLSCKGPRPLVFDDLTYRTDLSSQIKSYIRKKRRELKGKYFYKSRKR